MSLERVICHIPLKPGVVSISFGDLMSLEPAFNVDGFTRRQFQSPLEI